MTKKYILFFVLLSTLTISLEAKDCTKDLQKEISTLRKRLDVVEVEYKKMFNEINCNLNINNSKLDELKKEIELLKNKKVSISSEILVKIEDNEKSIAKSQEIESIIVKYGNNSDGLPPLHSAIKQGDVNAVKVLIEKGADVNSVCEEFRPQSTISALSRAAMNNQYEIALLLIGYGSDVNFCSHEDCFYPIYYAAKFGSENILRLFIINGAKLDNVSPKKYNYPETPLHLATKAGNYEAVVALIEAGSNVNAVSDHGNTEGTALDVAAKYLKYQENPKNLELVKFLVEIGSTRVSKKYHDNGFNRDLCPVISGYLKSIDK